MSARSEETERARVALKPIETVLVGSSLLDASDPVVRAAADVAAAASGRLAILHALPMDELLPRIGDGWSDADFPGRRIDLLGQGLEAQIARLDITVPTTSRVSNGSPHREILRTAESMGADLIVVGASDRGGFSKFLGGTADRVLRGAHCPVLVVRGEWRFPIGKVVAPVDFSLLSADALDCALGFLLQIDESAPEVELFFAVSELQQSMAEPFTPDQIGRFALQELRNFGVEHVGSSPARLSYKVAVGPPAREILREAEELAAGLLVIGTHGQGGVERAFLGSVARAVATEAACPVLVIPPEVAMGASVAEAVLEQTEPRWRAPESAGNGTPEGRGVQ